MKPGAPDTVLGPSPGSGQRRSLQAREAGLGEKMAVSVDFLGSPALELSADRLAQSHPLVPLLLWDSVSTPIKWSSYGQLLRVRRS